MTTPEAPRDVAERISREIALTHRKSYGEAVQDVRTHLLDDAVLCALDVTLQPHERTLLAAGHGQESIKELRGLYQEAIGATYVATSSTRPAAA